MPLSLTAAAALLGIEGATKGEPIAETFVKIFGGVSGLSTPLFFLLLEKMYDQLKSTDPAADSEMRERLSLLTDNLIFAIALNMVTFGLSLLLYIRTPGLVLQYLPWALTAFPYLILFLVLQLGWTLIVCFARMCVLVRLENERVYPEQKVVYESRITVIK